MGSQQFCLRWNNHQSNILTVFDKLLSNGSFVDVTLACEGSSLKAHKMVLSACSPFFEEIFIENPCKHPVVIMRDIKLMDLKAIIEFMYKGEVSVGKEQLGTLIKTAEALKIKGLAEITNEQTQKVVKPSLPLQFCGGKLQVTRTEDESSEISLHHRKRKRKNSGENGDVEDDIQPVDMTQQHESSRSELTCVPKANSLNNVKPKDKPVVNKLYSSMRNNNNNHPDVPYVNSHLPIKAFPTTPFKQIKQSPPSSPVHDSPADNSSEYVMDSAAATFYRNMNLEMMYPGQSTAYNHPASGLNLMDSLKNEYSAQDHSGEKTEIRPESLIRGRGRAPNWTQDDMRSALQAVMSGHGSKKTARLYNIPWSTLKRYIRRTRAQPDTPFQGICLPRNTASPIGTPQTTDLAVENVNLFNNNNESGSVADSPSTNQDIDTSTNSSPTPGGMDQSLVEPVDNASGPADAELASPAK